MQLVKRDDTLVSDPDAKDTWSLMHLSGGRSVVVTRCSNGHIGQLDHEIAADGTVSPSVVCQRGGCSYHEFIRLEGWTYGAKPRGAFLLEEP